MPDKDNPQRPRSRRPSYLGGPAGPAKAAPPEAAQSVQPKQEEVVPEEDKEILRWKVWLMPRRRGVSAAVIITLLICVGIAYWAFPNFMFVAVISFILLNRLAPYLFPVTYVLTEQTAGYKTLFARDQRQWNRIFTYYEFPDGVLLSNDTRSVRGRMREGMFVYFEDGAANKEQVLDIVKVKLKAPKEAMAPKADDANKGGVGSAIQRIKRLRQKD